MKDYKFARTIWANIKLSKLCPGNDVKKLGDVLAGDDTAKQLETMMQVIEIMNMAFIKKMNHEEPGVVYDQITREDMENMSDEELIELVNKAFADFNADGETTIAIEEKKEEAV